MVNFKIVFVKHSKTNEYVIHSVLKIENNKGTLILGNNLIEYLKDMIVFDDGMRYPSMCYQLILKNCKYQRSYNENDPNRKSLTNRNILSKLKKLIENYNEDQRKSNNVENIIENY